MTGAASPVRPHRGQQKEFFPFVRSVAININPHLHFPWKCACDRDFVNAWASCSALYMISLSRRSAIFWAIFVGSAISVLSHRRLRDARNGWRKGSVTGGGVPVALCHGSRKCLVPATQGGGAPPITDPLLDGGGVNKGVKNRFFVQSRRPDTCYFPRAGIPGGSHRRRR